MRIRCLIVLLLTAVAAGTFLAQRAVAVVLTQAATKQAGIVFEPLPAANEPVAVHALGTVLNPDGLLNLDNQIVAANAKIAETKAKLIYDQKEEQRFKILAPERAVAEQKVDRATANVAKDQATLVGSKGALAALLDQTRLEWGSTLAAALQSSDDSLLAQLSSGAAILIGVSLSPNVSLKTPAAEATAQADGIGFPVTLIGPVPQRLGGYPGQNYIYKAATQPNAPIGTTVLVALAQSSQREGVIVPRAAVVWRSGQALVFRATGENRFEAQPITPGPQVKDGYFVVSGLRPGERVVVRGAGFLVGSIDPSQSAAGDAD